MTETYLATIKPTPDTWDGLTPLTASEAWSFSKPRTHPRRPSFSGWIALVVTETTNWTPAENEPENIFVQGWTREECESALRSEVAARNLTGTLEVTQRND